MAEGLGNAERRLARFVDLGCDAFAAGHHRATENSVAMFIAWRLPEGVAPVGPTGDDHRELRLEGNAGLGDRRLLADIAPRGRRVRGIADPRLAFAIIAVTPGLEDERSTEFTDGG